MKDMTAKINSLNESVQLWNLQVRIWSKFPFKYWNMSNYQYFSGSWNSQGLSQVMSITLHSVCLFQIPRPTQPQTFTLEPLLQLHQLGAPIASRRSSHI